MTSLKPYKDDLYKLWDEFWGCQKDEEKSRAEKIQSFIKALDYSDAEDFYLWGLSVYSESSQDSLDDSHKLFLKSLGSEEDYYLARLYSAHCFHDKGNYLEALAEYLKVDQERLKQEMPIWRWVKLLEQIGFCYVKIGRLNEAVPYFESVIKSYLSYKDNELVPVQEAYECLPKDHLLVRRLKEAEEVHFAQPFGA